MERITYEAPGLIDWSAQIRVGRATLKVHFTGGAPSAYGVTPAEYTTDNPFMQRVIEQSGYFKEGRIRIGRREGMPEPEKPKAAPAPADDAEADDAEGGEPVGLVEFEVTCLQDAQDFLQREYGIPSYKVRYKTTAQRAAKEHGVVFVGGGFSSENAEPAEE